MKITKVRATPVTIPLDAPFFWSVGLYPGTSKTIIEVETDEGIVGLGESPSWDCAEVINKSLGPRLIGRDPIDIAGCEMQCVPEWRVVQNTDDASIVKAFGGIEIALWDIRGKAWNKPLYELLGGAVRKEIPFSTHIPDIRRAVALGTPDNIVTNFAVLGGVRRAVRFIGACEAMGVGFWCYSGDAGICNSWCWPMISSIP